ncbi:MAG TPA: hypothetical protein VFF04_01755 [Candidatus Babeliales bacterium]|nr:hypothetical protein [Candidatus Babeliales bacterium]
MIKAASLRSLTLALLIVSAPFQLNALPTVRDAFTIAIKTTGLVSAGYGSLQALCALQKTIQAYGSYDNYEEYVLKEERNENLVKAAMGFGGAGLAGLLLAEGISLSNIAHALEISYLITLLRRI